MKLLNAAPVVATPALAEKAGEHQSGRVKRRGVVTGVAVVVGFLAVIAGKGDLEIVTGLEQQLAVDRPEILVVVGVLRLQAGIHQGSKLCGSAQDGRSARTKAQNARGAAQCRVGREHGRRVDAPTGCQVLDITPMRAPFASNRHGNVFAQRKIQEYRSLEGVLGAKREPRLARYSFGTRLAGDDVDCAAGGVAAIERARRTLDHFDAFDIDEIVHESSEHARHVVDEGGDAGIGADEDRVADAADEHLVVARRVRRHEARRRQLQIAHLADARIVQLVAAHRGDRQRHVEHALCLALGSNDDFLDAAVVRFPGAILGEGRCGDCRQGENRRGGAQRACA